MDAGKHPEGAPAVTSERPEGRDQPVSDRPLRRG
jgi:hypothetical protein